MADVRINLYEGMFLLNQQAVASDFAGCIEHIKDIFKRAEAEVLVLTKWDERKLAYEVHGQKRGVFILAYFKARGSQIANIERDCTLSEQILRSLIIRAEHVGETELEVAKKNADLSLEAKLRSPGEGAGRTPGTPAPGSSASGNSAHAASAKSEPAVATAEDDGDVQDTDAEA